jgi:hypothetical protein
MGPVELMLADFLGRFQKLLDEGIPRELGLDVGVCNVPNAGKALFCSFLWGSSDFEAGNAALERMNALGQIYMNTVKEMTVPAWLKAQSDATPPYGVYAPAGPANIIVPSFGKNICDVLVEYTASIPANPATLWVEHHVHGAALDEANAKKSCFGYRQRHVMIEIVGTSALADTAKESGDWATAMYREARAVPSALRGGYIVLAGRDVEPKACFPGGKWEKLQILKKKVDPANVFTFNVVGLDGRV